jgi:hypothetical protein
MNIIYNVSFNTKPAQPLSRDRVPTASGGSYQAAMRHLAAVKARLEGKFRPEMADYEQLLKTALNEAEALAWQTSYPHLFFPVLAEEKAAEARQWTERQLAIRERTSPGYPQLQLAA